jgi:acetolactate synthase small subunit
MISDDEDRWVAFVRADHRTGTIAALAGVFATRGVNFESLATGDVEGDDGLVVVTFRTSERRQRVLVRSVERLDAVRSVLVRRAEDLGVRAAAVVRLPGTVDFRPPKHAAVSWSGSSLLGQPVLVEGPLVDVEAVVASARAAGALVQATVIEPPAAT